MTTTIIEHVLVENMAKVLTRRAVGLQNEVKSFLKHPSGNTRARLKAEANKLSGAFSFGLEMIGYREFPDIRFTGMLGAESRTHNVRQEVEKARAMVTALYAPR